jgi:hypothetical protein
MFNDFKRLLQNHSIFQHVLVAATSIIRASSPCKLEHHRYKTLFILLCIRSKIHFTTFISVKLGKHWMRSGVEIIEHHKEAHSNSKWMSSSMYKFWQQLHYDNQIIIF